jgi:hypothetical protein
MALNCQFERPVTRIMLRLCFAIGVRAALTAFFFLAPAVSANSFNYLYVEASEGNSSGGHTAIQFDDDIYHFQHLDSGLIRLFRREKADFHFHYRYLQNRPMHLSRVEVEEDTFDLLKNQFKWKFLAQERQFKWLDDLHKDRTFIRYLLQKSKAGHTLLDADATSILRLKGVGLFYPEPGQPLRQPASELTKRQSQSIQSLRKKVEQRYGADFLHRRRARAEAQINTLAPSQWPVIDPDFTDDSFPASVYSFTERYTDCLTALYALKAIDEARPLQPDALLSTKRQAFRISAAERRALKTLRRDLETGFIEALDSNRPDWGYAVLVNLARYLAVEASLLSGYWFFVDDFGENPEWVKPDQYLRHKGQIRVLLNDAQVALNRHRQLAAARERLTETEWSQIEMIANRYFELLKSEQQRGFRMSGENALPSKSIAFPEGPTPNLTPERLTTALSALDNVERSLFQKLQQEYRYDLITRNCVTELFRTIHQALLKPYGNSPNRLASDTLAVKESVKRLGGYVDSAYNFIPFVSYRSVRDQYRVTQSRDLDSYRGMALKQIMSRQNRMLTALKESNIVSSRLYQYNPDDALFVFFTDDNVFLRPLFGLFNTTAGIGQSLYGFFSWPWDSGKNLQSGATGILMSLPELVFFNMRKGSYKYLSVNQLANSDIPG